MRAFNKDEYVATQIKAFTRVFLLVKAARAQKQSEAQGMIAPFPYIGGKYFLFSLNDIPETRRIFSSFYIEEVVNFCAIKKPGKQRKGELLISNYKQQAER